MMFTLSGKLPMKCLVAVSGGIDSMSALHWLSNKSKRVRGIVHVNHGTDFGHNAENFVYENYNGIIYRERLENSTPQDRSKEDWWREKRYEFFDKVASEAKLPIVLAHNLDDCVEEYIMATMVRGYQGTIPYRHGPCIRPFRFWKRSDIEAYAKRNNIKWIEDPSNQDTSYKRNHIRHNVVPQLLELNPGLYTYVSRFISNI